MLNLLKIIQKLESIKKSWKIQATQTNGKIDWERSNFEGRYHLKYQIVSLLSKRTIEKIRGANTSKKEEKQKEKRSTEKIRLLIVIRKSISSRNSLAKERIKKGVSPKEKGS